MVVATFYSGYASQRPIEFVDLDDPKTPRKVTMDG
jgi:hypothetical protein